MKIMPRSAWGAKPPRAVTFSAPSSLKGVCVHWFGSPRAAKTHSGCPALLRSVQAGHMAPGGLGAKKGGVDIGYSHAVCPHGQVYELRGFHARTGANGTSATNREYAAVVAMLGTGDKVPEIVTTRLRQLIAEWRKQGAGRAVRTHGSITGSECPGPMLALWVERGGYEFPPPAKPDTFWTWARWWRGHGEYRKHGPRNPQVRPNVPRRIPSKWWGRLRRNIRGRR